MCVKVKEKSFQVSHGATPPEVEAAIAGAKYGQKKPCAGDCGECKARNLAAQAGTRTQVPVLEQSPVGARASKDLGQEDIGDMSC
jgi:hypothetical protein